MSRWNRTSPEQRAESPQVLKVVVTILPDRRRAVSIWAKQRGAHYAYASCVWRGTYQEVRTLGDQAAAASAAECALGEYSATLPG